jgi:hypothetical protein
MIYMYIHPWRFLWYLGQIQWCLVLSRRGSKAKNLNDFEGKWIYRVVAMS